VVAEIGMVPGGHRAGWHRGLELMRPLSGTRLAFVWAGVARLDPSRGILARGAE
jgi:hypothetical protein